MADRWDEALTAAGVYHETYLFPGADHGYDGNWTSSDSQVTRAKVRKFLEAHGGLEEHGSRNR